MEEKSTKGPRFRHTRELVQLAVNDGMTQEQIRRLCRVQQSVVSAWASGRRKATEQQIEPLLKRYGARLNRGVSRLYLVPATSFEESEVGRALASMRNAKTVNQQTYQELESRLLDPENVSYMGEFVPRRLAELERAAHIEHLSLGPHRLVLVQGRVLFRYTFRQLRARLVRRDEPGCAGFPVARWILHPHPTDRERLILIRQRRRELGQKGRTRVLGAAEETLKEQLGCGIPSGQTRQQSLYRLGLSQWLDSPEDAGRWVSVIDRPRTAADLMKFTLDFLGDAKRPHNPHDEAVLPFLLARALVELGLEVPGVERYTPPE